LSLSRVFGLPQKLVAYVCGTLLLATPVVVLSLAGIAHRPPSARTAGAVALFFALTLLADLQPVPMDEEGKSEVSIANVFIVTAAILFGWRYAVPLAGLSVGITFAVARRPLSRTLFNVSMYALSALAASVPVILLGPLHGADANRLTAYVLAGAVLHLVSNVSLVSGAIALAEKAPYHRVLVSGLRHSGPAFAIMAFLAALTANLWTLEAWLLVLLAGPLFTLTLYQRSAHHSRIATRDARTDNLTGLGNHRAYQEALRETLDRSGRTGDPFSLALIDVDNFKHVNDSFGHPAGDEVLVLIGRMLSSLGYAQAFRFGGDEFAVLFSLDEMSSYRMLERIQHELSVAQASGVGSVTISIGIASYPAHAQTADELQRTADGALYHSKRHGKNRSCLYSPSVVRLYSPAELERETGLADLAMALLAQPAVNVRLEGFVDATTDHSSDHKLSLSMAQAMAQRLADLGVQSSRVAWAGRGGESPRLPNFTIRGRAANRRIEVVVVR